MNDSEMVALLNADGSIKYWNTAQGRLEKNGTNYTAYCYLKDHLGTTRSVLKDGGVAPNEGYDLDPMGVAMPNRFYTLGSFTKERFTDKERDAETRLDYFGARYYASGIGRWLGMDPMAGKFPNMSPYNYVGNNPVNGYDPDGMEYCPASQSNCNNGGSYNLADDYEVSRALRNPTGQEIYNVGYNLVNGTYSNSETANKALNLLMSTILKESGGKQFETDENGDLLFSFNVGDKENLRKTLLQLAKAKQFDISATKFVGILTLGIMPVIGQNSDTNFDIGILQVNSNWTSGKYYKWGDGYDLFRLGVDWQYNIETGWGILKTELEYAWGHNPNEADIVITSYMGYNGGRKANIQYSKYRRAGDYVDAYNNALTVLGYYNTQAWRTKWNIK